MTRCRRPAAPSALDDGDFENHCPTCGATLTWALVDEDARLDPRSSYAASKLAQEHYTSSWVRQAEAAAVALRYHNVYGPGMPRDTPYSGVAAMFRSSLERGEAPQVFEDGGQMRDFVHVDDVARANVAAHAVVGRGTARVLRRLQRRLRAPGRHPRRGPARGAGDRARDRARRSPAATGSATSGTSSRRPRARPPSSASPPRCCRRTGCRRSRLRRCGTDGHVG